jgi:hypothetical protein
MKRIRKIVAVISVLLLGLTTKSLGGQPAYGVFDPPTPTPPIEPTLFERISPIIWIILVPVMLIIGIVTFLKFKSKKKSNKNKNGE